MHASRFRSTPARSALAAAVCATFATTAAQADLVIVDIPDVTLGTYDLVIEGQLVYSFFLQDTGAPGGTGAVDTYGNRVVGVVCVDDPTVDPEECNTKPAGTYALPLLDPSIDFTGPYVSGNNVGLEKFYVEPFIEAVLGKGDGKATQYLGLNFDLPDGVHKGWVEILTEVTAPDITDSADSTDGADSVDGDPTFTITLQRYAYDDRPISIPEPASLALLIAGAAGVAAMRRRKRNA